MRRTALLYLLALLPIFVSAQVADDVIMNIDGNDVMKSEFEYFLKKNRNSEEMLTKKELKEYADLFLNFKLKVAAAERAGLDTTATFLSEYKQYRGMQAEAYLVDSAYLESLAKQTFEASAREVGPDGIANLHIITIIPESNAQEDMDAAAHKIDSIFNVLRQGANFNETAAKYSQDGAARNGGIVGWVSRNQVPDFIAERAFSMPVNEMSAPFLCEMGYMIIRVTERQDFGDYSEHRTAIYEWMDNQGYNLLAKREKAKKIASEQGWEGLSDDEAVARADSMLEDLYPEFELISKEYYDGLLMFEISNSEVWQKSTSDTLGLEEFFEKNKKSLEFEVPRFKGMLFFCKSEQVFNDIAAALENCEESKQIEVISGFNKEEQNVRILRGPIEKGRNTYVDAIVFGEGEYEPREDYPYIDIIGKAIKYPEELDDAYGDAVNAYQDYLEKMWIKQMRKEIPYKVNKKILQSVTL